MNREIVGVAVFIGVTLLVAWAIGRAAVHLAEQQKARSADELLGF